MSDQATLQRPSIRMTHQNAVEIAKALAVKLEPFADECEQIRRMPPAAVELVMESGLMPLVRPAHYGGYELSWQTLIECLTEIGRVSGSMTWCIAFLLHHQWILSYFPQAVQDQVYATHKDPKIVDSFAPSGKAVKVDGGYRVTGEWAFGSGGDHCDWAIVGVLIPREGGPPTLGWPLFRPGQFWIRDTWHSIGLKGSGSNNIVIEDAFVEDAFMVDGMSAMTGALPPRPDIKGPMYQTGVAAQFQFGLASPLLGVARGLYNNFLEFTADKVGALGGGRKAEDPMMQLVVGESAAEIEAGHSILRRNNDLVMAGQRMGPTSSAEFIRDIGLIARLVLSASDRLHNASGGRGLAEGNLFGRHWRDVHAITNHAALQYRGMFRGYGQSVLVGPAAPRH